MQSEAGSFGSGVVVGAVGSRVVVDCVVVEEGVVPVEVVVGASVGISYEENQQLVIEIFYLRKRTDIIME